MGPIIGVTFMGVHNSYYALPQKNYPPGAGGRGAQRGKATSHFPGGTGGRGEIDLLIEIDLFWKKIFFENNLFKKRSFLKNDLF